MMSSRTTTLWSRFAALAAAAVLGACATAPTSQSPEDLVKTRATERAAAFVKGDLERSYALVTPSYRKLRSLDQYKRSFGAGGSWEKAEVKTVACEPQRCKVGVSVSVKPLIGSRFGDTITVQFEEIWLLEDGNWWLHQGL